MTYLFHWASFHSNEWIAPSNPGIKHLEPLDLIALARPRATGNCDFDMPEVIFDLNLPGHYHSRIAAVISASFELSVSTRLSLVSNGERRTATGAT